MSDVLQKIKNRWTMIRTNFRQDCCFSKKYAFYRLADELPARLGFRKISNYYHGKKDQYILSYLYKLSQPILDKYRHSPLSGTPSVNAPIWIFWWDGFSSAPPLVQQCIKSIQKHAGAHTVNFITKDNYEEYLEIPSFFLDKIHSESIKLAHFADYLRVSLLQKYGGLWLDATIFCSRQIPEEYFHTPFFTCRSEEQECGYISRMRWVTFILAGYSGCLFYTILKEIFELYWSQHNCAIDYLFFDHLIYLMYTNVPSIKTAIDSLPPNNIHRDDLQAAMNAALPADKFSEIITDDTVLYKLSWRESYAETANDGTDTIYGAFISGRLPGP